MGCRTSHDTDVKPLVCFTSVLSVAGRESDAREEKAAQLLASEQLLREEAGEMHLAQETLHEIERIMRAAVPIGGLAPEGM